MPRIGVVLNPRSRRNRRDPGASARLEKVVGADGMVRAAPTIEALADIAQEFRECGIDVLAISGGDGTNHVTLGGFAQIYGDAPLPAVALLRGGTMNTVANAVGVRRGNPEALLARLATHIRRGSTLVTTTRHLLRAGDHHGFLFGTGAIHGFLAEYYRGGEPTPLVAARTLARGVGSALIGGDAVRRIVQPFEGSVTVHGAGGEVHEWPDRAYLAIGAGTVDQIGLGFRPFFRHREHDGAFHLLGIHTTAAGFVRDLPRIRAGISMSSKKTFEAVATRAIVRARKGVVRFMIDGDLYEQSGELELAAGPAVRIATLA